MGAREVPWTAVGAAWHLMVRGRGASPRRVHVAFRWPITYRSMACRTPGARPDRDALKLDASAAVGRQRLRRVSGRATCTQGRPPLTKS